jgi:hypothetical protein
MIKNKVVYKAIQLLGIAVVGISALSICGYLAGNPELYTWKLSFGMPLNSSIAFILIGIAVYLIGRDIESLKKYL